MNRRLLLLAIAAAWAASIPVAHLHAGEDAAASPTPADSAAPDVSAAPAPSSPASSFKPSWEFNADTSYVGGASTDFGDGRDGNVSEERTRTHLVLGLQQNDGPIYRFGLQYQRYSFGFSRAAPLPDLLESENVIVGVDFQLFNSWLVRVEADPGFYGDGRGPAVRSFNVPVTIGGSYITGADVQWILGLEYDPNRQIPVYPAVGVRWQFMDQWVLDLILPTPRLEYNYSKDLTLYLGSDVDDGSFRMSPRFAQAYASTEKTTQKSVVTNERIVGYHFSPPFITPVYQSYQKTVYTTVPSTVAENLAGATVEYDEIRVGAGMSWKAAKGVTLEIESGYLPYREFDFHRADVHFTNDGGAAYGQVSLNAQF